MTLSPELRAKLEARGLDPDDIYASLLRDADNMLAEIRAGTWMIDTPLWWRNRDASIHAVGSHRLNCQCARCLDSELSHLRTKGKSSR